ncbi:F-box/LRR-repeat protein 7 isoform X2 [Condylostylus longicornis]|uniref:F-box/LRR-repeat protein 7 isoform X2 n=1 Tax=Condylostylus longicornis TaxID=2530218 RepID=UPI00244DF844|nr:F-box/LRR-repeat protein 7 isoform X2 [Condylostylus longicornis]
MTHQTRRGAPPPHLECPLASLGRSSNTPTSSGLELNHQAYHHPLSSSPLNPQIYHQMSRQSPNDDDDTDEILYTSTSSSGQYQELNGIINNSNSQSQNDSSGMEMYTLSRSSSDSIEPSPAPSSLSSASSASRTKNGHCTTTQNKQQQFQKMNNNNCQLRRTVLIEPIRRNRPFPPPRQHLTPSIETILPSSRLKNTDQRICNPNSYINDDHDSTDDCNNNSSSKSPSINGVNSINSGVGSSSGGHNGSIEDSNNTNANNTQPYSNIINHQRAAEKLGCNGVENSNDNGHDLQQYYLEQKMDVLYLHGAIRGLPIGSDINHFKSEQYFLDESSLSKFCDYNNERNGCDRLENIIDSETSSSERFLIDRSRGSPAFINSHPHHTPSYTNNSHQSNSNISFNEHSPLKNSSSSNQLPSPSFNTHQTKIKNFSDGLTNIGRFSPSLDQGYATLVSPSPTASAHQIPGPWTKKIMTRCNNSNIGFDRLSDDIIMKIFSWFDNCELCKVAQVCRRFENLAWRPPLWKFIIIKGEHISGDRALKMIFRRLCGQTRNGACPDVQRVMLSEGCRISDKGLQLLTRRCPELTHLQLQSCTISNQALSDVLTKCTNLQHLDVTGCTSVASIGMNSNLEPPRRLLLQYLDLTDCTSIDDIGLKIVVRNCPQLVFLYLRRCLQITDSGLKFVPSFCIALKELSVSDCINITDFGLYELAKLGAVLRYLSVAKCDRVSDAGLKVIARRCYKLRYLNCRGLEAVSDDSITFLARSCPRLRALDIGKCDVSDAGLRAIAESCPNLKKLSLRNCDMITDRGIQCIAYYCRGLQQLNIQDCQISIEGYRAVKKYCKRCIIEHTNPGFY